MAFQKLVLIALINYSHAATIFPKTLDCNQFGTCPRDGVGELDQDSSSLFLSTLSKLAKIVLPSASKVSSIKQPSFCGSVISFNDKGRIVNGKEAGLGQFPWQAQILAQKTVGQEPTFVCGGSLITEELVVTAAHCIQFTNVDRYSYRG